MQSAAAGAVLRCRRLPVTIRPSQRTPSLMSTSVKRELIWLGVALFAALVAFPLLVYATGMLTLGAYSRGGAGRFLVDFLHSLGRLEWQALALAVAPLTLIVGWRVIRALRSRDEYVAARPARDASERREPTL
jgi:hypothetical protein